MKLSDPRLSLLELYDVKWMWIRPEEKQYVLYDSVYVVQEQVTLTNGNRNQNNNPDFKDMTEKKAWRNVPGCWKYSITSSQGCLHRCRHRKSHQAGILTICKLHSSGKNKEYGMKTDSMHWYFQDILLFSEKAKCKVIPIVCYPSCLREGD